jgi:hypothetical protein
MSVAASGLDQTELRSLESVRGVERVRIEAIRRNDADVMQSILDPKFVHINGNGQMYCKDSYLAAIRSRRLAYFSDLELTETDHRVDDDVVILVGMMRGHARLHGEQQAYQLRSMRVWKARGADWKLLAWQSSRMRDSPF